MIRALLIQIALMIAGSASAQDCQPLTLAALKQVYKASNRPNRIFAEGFALPLAKSDNSIVYHRCRRVIDYANEAQRVSLPELINDGNRSRTIWFATYDRDTYLGIKTRAQASYRVLPSLKSQSSLYSLGYTDGKTAYLFGATTLDDSTGATRFRIALMPLSSL
ncbi:hypothetical protein [Spirosoma fluviale]|uniref:Uncharacterized protein n=1 Tax=Spirosoma fluviale TaxID=1597977 RepID=A0A286G1Q7_9BACT|nr:hypothetical protein [Spirosoma fluviale]SOD88914.1 hypothetical protein SAMN06269250_2886 [Spirosoma fluviale]